MIILCITQRFEIKRPYFPGARVLLRIRTVRKYDKITSRATDPCVVTIRVPHHHPSSPSPKTSTRRIGPVITTRRSRAGRNFWIFVAFGYRISVRKKPQDERLFVCFIFFFQYKIRWKNNSPTENYACRAYAGTPKQHTWYRRKNELGRIITYKTLYNY